MRIALALIAASLLVPADGPVLAATARKSSTHKKKSSTARKGTRTTVRKGTTVHKATPGKSTTARNRKGRTTRTAKSRQTWRSRQLQPTPDRYQEIQQALIQKGYLKTTPDGHWDQASIDALQRFQKDQNLQPTGKIDSLSLIALGLGPKHESTASAKPPAANPTAQPQTP